MATYIVCVSHSGAWQDLAARAQEYFIFRRNRTKITLPGSIFSMLCYAKFQSQISSNISHTFAKVAI